MYKINAAGNIIRESDMACIPIDEGNADYQKYLAWCDEGNEAEQEILSVEYQKSLLQSKIEEIERVTMVPRVTREMMLAWAQLEASRQVEKLAAEGTQVTLEELLAANVAYQKVKAVEDQIEAIRDQIRTLDNGVA